jgi:hypothetical protein
MICLLCLSLQDTLLSLHRCKWEKGSTPDLHPCPVGGDHLRVWGWQLRLMTWKQLRHFNQPRLRNTCRNGDNHPFDGQAAYADAS